MSQDSAKPRRTNPPHVIRPTGVYSRAQARHYLRLQETTIRREIRLGRLRVARRAGRYYFLGAWLLEWIRAGEQKPRQRRTEAGGPTDRSLPEAA